MSTSVFEISEHPGLELAYRAVDQVVQGGSGAQVILLFGARGGGMEELAEFLSRRWMGKDGEVFDGSLETAVDYQKIEPSGKSRLLKIEIVKEVAKKRATEEFEGEDIDELTESKPKKDDFQGIPIIKFFRTRPLMAPKKVVWIVDADRMNGKTANALLKTLEEVPDYARLVMTTSDFGRVLPTIRSRSLCLACGAQVSGELTEMEKVFATTPGRLAFIREHGAVFEGLYKLLEGSFDAPMGQALNFSERARDLSSELASSGELGARAANGEILESIAQWSLVRHATNPYISQAATEAYRLVLGNGNAGLAFDSLFGTIFGLE